MHLALVNSHLWRSESMHLEQRGQPLHLSAGQIGWYFKTIPIQMRVQGLRRDGNAAGFCTGSFCTGTALKAKGLWLLPLQREWDPKSVAEYGRVRRPLGGGVGPKETSPTQRLLCLKISLKARRNRQGQAASPWVLWQEWVLEHRHCCTQCKPETRGSPQNPLKVLPRLEYVNNLPLSCLMVQNTSF